MVIEGGRYAFNYSVAGETCRRLNVTMATREQMERALLGGLETCKFGWIAEQIAVVPRLASDSKCGRGQTGLVVWRAQLDTEFAVFCYSASEASVATTSPVESPSSAPPTAPNPQTRTPPAATPSVGSTPSPTGAPTSSVRKKLRTLTPTSPMRTTRLAAMAPTAPPTRHCVTTPPGGASSPSWTTAPSSATRPVVVSTENSLGAGATALIILGVVALLVTASGAVCYHKLVDQRVAHRLQKDDPETDMWKHAVGEMDLRQQRGPGDEEEEESERKYSSEITLVVNPRIKETVSD